jgi:hypothetical protein
MDGMTALRCVCSEASYRVLHEPRPSPRSGSGCEPTHRLSLREALIPVLLLSLGLWALTWAAIFLFVYGVER